MDRRVVRVTVPIVREYDVVFEDGQPVFIGAVIPRPALSNGPNAGKIVDTHRTTWKGPPGSGYHFLGGRPIGLTGRVIAAALRVLAQDPDAGKDNPAPRKYGVARP